MNTATNARVALKRAALSAAGRGWHVFPLRPGTLEPAVRDWAARATTNTWRIIRCWETGPFNVGISVCASGLRVLDLLPAGAGEEPPEPFRLPGVTDGADVLAVLLEQHHAALPVETYSVSGPGRLQYYFAADPGTCPASAPAPLGWKVEVRCTGSYVAAAGSLTPDGPYEVMHGADPRPAPAWLRRPAAPESTKTLDSLQQSIV
ncbi:bifunctional DNA primase/polymerase [Streptomyces sp. NPDC012765]|uniref:bifunctional DNA primase/polymerase n=1 Tax=Streptomyces sp. NPDC012765 TaxID=3155249 RepID=UPI0033F3EF35